MEKIDVINEALILSGNDPVPTEDDDSDEWRAANAAWDKAVRHLLDEHDWKFATKIEALTRLGDSPDAETHEDEYAKPQNALHLIWVQVAGVFETDYRIVRNRIQINAAEDVVVKYVEEPEPDVWSGLFGQAMHCYVLAGCYRSLNEDPGEADKQEAKAEAFLARARTRGDQEEPGRARFISSMRAARRVRRG